MGQHIIVIFINSFSEHCMYGAKDDDDKIQYKVYAQLRFQLLVSTIRDD